MEKQDDNNILSSSILFCPLKNSLQKLTKTCFSLNVNPNFKFLDCQSVSQYKEKKYFEVPFGEQRGFKGSFWSP